MPTKGYRTVREMEDAKRAAADRAAVIAMGQLEHDKSEVIVCGRLPKKRDGSVDLYKIERLLLELDHTSERVMVLRRLLEFRPQ